jgi:protein-S-isoprenylcysteine O-methyltransferase Ste14
MLGKVAIQFFLLALYLVGVLFWPARTFAYPGGWALIGLMMAGGAAITAWLARHDPGLLRERMRSPLQRGQQGWDRAFLLFLMVSFTAWLAFSAWDAARHDFRAVPRWLQAVGALGVVAYMAGAWVTFRENHFAAPVVKLQEGQKVIDTGPYAIVRHPMYASALGLFLGTPPLLGSWWGLLGSAALIAGVAWRSVNEERVLRADLPGYEAYTKRVRSRFVPGVW